MKIKVVDPGFEIMTPIQQIRNIMKALEEAGKTCYKSEHTIKPESCNQFIDRIIRMGHESVIEHQSITVRIIGSRAMSHQLVRHRLAAYSQESQRYCNYMKKGYQIIVPSALAVLPADVYDWNEGKWTNTDGVDVSDADCAYFLDGIRNTLLHYEYYLERGKKPEMARYVLPNCMKTEVVTTYNLRTWRHIFKERALNPHAQKEIREIMLGILGAFKEHLPILFGDLNEKEESL